MKTFATYTLARLGIFLAAFGLVWLCSRPFLADSSGNLLWLALLALLISSVAAIFLLRGLRDTFAAEVQSRAQRMSVRYEEARSRDDRDD